MIGTTVRSFTDKELLERAMSVEGFKGFPPGRFIIGVRSKKKAFNVYDDKFFEYENIKNATTNDISAMKFIRVLTGTTEPGGSILKKGWRKFNKYGAAILASDKWYYNLWQYGLHNGKMPALKQVGSQVSVFRDGDDDEIAEELGKPISGWYGINYHTNTYDFSKASKSIISWFIGGWSAGCQVVNAREQYFEQMDWYEYSLRTGYQKFVSYCLLKEF